jgi:Zn-dependent protease with chaperone function
MNETAGKAPIHLWVLGILSLLWNCFGCYEYVMSHIGGLAFFEARGADAAAFAWFEAMPAWTTAMWAIGVWVSLLGSILLLARSRYAAPAFLVSLVGALASFGWRLSVDRPPSLQGNSMIIEPLVISIAIIAQWYYAKRMSDAGVLR